MSTEPSQKPYTLEQVAPDDGIPIRDVFGKKLTIVGVQLKSSRKYSAGVATFRAHVDDSKELFTLYTVSSIIVGKARQINESQKFPVVCMAIKDGDKSDSPHILKEWVESP